MNIVIIIILSVAGIVGLILIRALFMRKEHFVKREIIINAPQQNVFNYIKFIRNEETFNKHAMVAPDRKREFKGTDGTVGFIYSWKGNKDAGEGEKEIINITEGKSIETEIRFVKPMVASARIIFDTESLPGGTTRISWSNAGTLKYPFNILIPTMEKSVAKGMDESLNTLKNILEKSAAS